jgi:para-nitrobenzyl esterase
MLPRRAVLGGLVASGLGAALAPFDPAFARDMLRVRVRQGLLRGRMEGGVRVFTGIPYGHAARFGRPVPARDWADERDATQPARAAPQPQDAGAVQAEDCLQLNVWAPAAPPPRIPATLCSSIFTAAATRPAGAARR